MQFLLTIIYFLKLIYIFNLQSTYLQSTQVLAYCTTVVVPLIINTNNQTPTQQSRMDHTYFVFIYVYYKYYNIYLQYGTIMVIKSYCTIIDYNNCQKNDKQWTLDSGQYCGLCMLSIISGCYHLSHIIYGQAIRLSCLSI